MNNKIIRCFLDTSMNLSHPGLTKLAEKHKIALATLEPGEHVIFINRAWTLLKLYSRHNVFHYLRMPPNQKISPEAIQWIMHTLNPGGTMDYDKAVKNMLQQKIGVKGNGDSTGSRAPAHRRDTRSDGARMVARQRGGNAVPSKATSKRT